jgi:hypothetical protein
MHAYSDGKQCSCWGVFIISAQKKLIFIILAPKDGFFCQVPTKKPFQLVPPKFSRILYHIVYTNHQLVAPQKIYRYLLPKRQMLLIQLEAGEI